MKSLLLSFLFIFTCTLSGIAQESDEIDKEPLFNELEKQLELSKDKLEQLKPVLKKKTEELNLSLQESIDEGFTELDKLNETLSKVSKETEEKAKDILTSEEVVKLRNYLSKIDKEAMDETAQVLADELAELLQLTEDQLTQLGPVLTENFSKLNMAARDLIKTGASGLDSFVEQFDQLRQELKKEMETILNKEQIEIFDKNSEELKETIEQKIAI